MRDAKDRVINVADMGAPAAPKLKAVYTDEDRAAILSVAINLLHQTPIEILIAYLPVMARRAGANTMNNFTTDAMRKAIAKAG